MLQFVSAGRQRTYDGSSSMLQRLRANRLILNKVGLMRLNKGLLMSLNKSMLLRQEYSLKRTIPC